MATITPGTCWCCRHSCWRYGLQFRVKATYSKYSKVRSVRGRTAAEVARQILNDHGLSYVQVDQIGGELTDNYDPRTNIVHLSQGVYSSTSIAAIGVAAHECGHAVQHAEEYGPLKLRSAIIPITNIGSSLSIPIFFIGLLFNYTLLMNIGILLFGLVALFQLITLPVEFNASRRGAGHHRGARPADRGRGPGRQKGAFRCGADLCGGAGFHPGPIAAAYYHQPGQPPELTPWQTQD